MRPMIPEMGTCCPGHDKYSSECYGSNRSKRAHTRDTRRGHRAVRRTDRQRLRCEAVDD